jgi:hypothetical protein
MVPRGNAILLPRTSADTLSALERFLSLEAGLSRRSVVLNGLPHCGHNRLWLIRTRLLVVANIPSRSVYCDLASELVDCATLAQYLRGSLWDIS